MLSVETFLFLCEKYFILIFIQKLGMRVIHGCALYSNKYGSHFFFSLYYSRSYTNQQNNVQQLRKKLSVFIFFLKQGWLLDSKTLKWSLRSFPIAFIVNFFFFFYLVLRSVMQMTEVKIDQNFQKHVSMSALLLHVQSLDFMEKRFVFCKTQ